MDLLAQEYENNKNTQEPKNKKKVLTALIISVVLLVLILIIRPMLSGTGPKQETYILNAGAPVVVTENMSFVDEEGKKYISISELAALINYKYYNGEYAKETEDRNKCYLTNVNYIIGFTADSNEIYKTEEGSITDYQIYKLNNKVIKNNENLYIAVEDASSAMDIILNYDVNANQLQISTPAYWTETLQKQYDEAADTTKIDTDPKNQNAIAYNMIVVSKDEKYGVLNAEKTSEYVIGAKYSSMKFDEYTKNFIVSNNKKYGVIDSKGSGVLDLKYEEVSVINYNPVLYAVKQGGKYGVVDKDGKILVGTKYDNLGYNETIKTNSNSVLIIRNINNYKNTIVVVENGKYGLVNISNGEEIIPCTLDAIYSKTSDDELVYYVVLDKNEARLDAYLTKLNTKTVNVTE